MARGSQRNGSKRRGKGAAPKRKRARPPAIASAAGAAPALPGAADLVDRMGSPEGKKLELADLVLRSRLAQADATGRDLASLMTLEKHGLLGIARIDSDEKLPEKLADLEAQVTELKAAVAGKRGSALRAEAAVVPPLVNDGEQRADLEAPTPTARGGEPYKS